MFSSRQESTVRLCITSNCIVHHDVTYVGNEKWSTRYNSEPFSIISQLFSHKGTEVLSYIISKAMGYLIIIGSLVMKLPQIVQIVRCRSVVGLNIYSFYFECAENIPIVIYNIVNKYPFSTYGECVIILVQAVILVYLYHQYTKNPKITNTLMYRNFFLLGIFAFSMMFFPTKFQSIIPMISTVLGLSARIPQIVANFRQGHTGQLSLITWLFSLAGSAVRIFTTLVEVSDKLILFMFLSGFLCNLTLVLQIFWYWKRTNIIIRQANIV